jgi:hypothetical protein
MNIVTDGSVFYAYAFPTPQYAGKLSDGSPLFTRTSSGHLIISDIALHGTTRYLLGYFALERETPMPFPIVWRTILPPPGQEPVPPKPVHFLHSPEAADAMRNSAPPYTGALAMGADGTLYVVTAIEPGVFAYRADGKALPPLGTDLRALTVPHLRDVVQRYRADELGRHRDLLNKQPTIDDLIITPDGPALVVRTVKGDLVSWDIWYPGTTGLRATIGLAMTRPGPFGHTRCDARGTELVCVLDQPEDPLSSELGPASLYFFHLPRLLK